MAMRSLDNVDVTINSSSNNNNINQNLVDVDEEEEEELMDLNESTPIADQTAELIGDGSQPYALPTLKKKHERFKRIDAATLVKLIDGNFSDKVETFSIIDCRYPYEYQGGHIIDSLNIHTSTELNNRFLDNNKQSSTNGCQQATKKHIIIFHCEFSSERGPKLMKSLRERDRQLNQKRYPKLMYPELYLLEGGYKEFYRKFKEYCVPQAYRTMKSKAHRDELRKYRKPRKAAAASRRRKENTPDISFEG